MMRKFIATFAVLVLTAAAGVAQAADVSVENAWARASAGMAKAGIAFMTVKNAGDSDDKVIDAEADVAHKAELHTHKMEDGVMKMRPVDFIPVPAGGKAMLEPGSYHVMFMGLKAPLKEGETFPLTLVFESGAKVTTTVTVKAPGAMGGGMGMDAGKMDMKH